jgi:hypothetical protein
MYCFSWQAEWAYSATHAVFPRGLHTLPPICASKLTV